MITRKYKTSDNRIFEVHKRDDFNFLKYYCRYFRLDLFEFLSGKRVVHESNETGFCFLVMGIFFVAYLVVVLNYIPDYHYGQLK